MAETPSRMLKLGTQAPAFKLPNMNKTAGPSTVSLSDYQDQAVLVAFICNHCPYVVLLIAKLAELARKWQRSGVHLVAICSNDIEHYPADAPGKMTEFAQKYEFRFPYLYDESQQVAKAYKAACTPDFFLFNRAHELVYRGQFDSARPANGQPVTGYDLDEAVKNLINGQTIEQNQIASVGCNIKWKVGNEPEYG